MKNFVVCKPSLLSLALFSAFTAPLHAQQQKTESDVKTQESRKTDAKAPASNGAVQTVEVQGKTQYDERRLDTATKIVVTQEEILKYGDSNLGDVMKRLPGVTVGGVQGRGGAIRMRGLGSGYTQIMLNGEPAPPGFSLDSLSPDMVERIEVIRAATAEHSTQAIAGSINIILKKAVQTAQRELKLGAQADGDKPMAIVNYQLSDKAGPWSYAIGGNLAKGKYDRPGLNTEQAYDASGKQILQRTTQTLSEGNFNSFGMAPRVNYNFANGDTLTTQNFINYNKSDGQNYETTQTSFGMLPNYSSNTQDFKSDFLMLRSNLNWVHKMADSAKLDVKFGLNYNKRSTDIGFTGFNQQAQATLQRTSVSDGSDKGLTSSGKYSAPFVEDHSLVFGWDLAYSKRNESRVQTDKILNGSTIKPINLDEVFDANVTRMAVFAQDEWQYSKQLSIYGGLRWEGINTKSSGSSFSTVDNRSAVWSPVLQVLYKLPDSKNDQIRAGITRTYKAPDTGRLIPRRFISLNNSPTSPDSMGNPDLKPELAWGLDLAYEHYFADGGNVSASVYYRRIDNVIHNMTSLIGDSWVSRPVNQGQATTKGIELDAKFPLRTFIKEAPQIDFRANLSLNWSSLSTVPGPDNRLDSQTPVSANLGLDYTVDGLPLTLGANAGFQSAGTVRISENQYSYGTPKRVLDVYGLWKFDRKTSLRLSFSNALHQDNYSQSRYVDSSGSTVQTTLSPTTVTTRLWFEHKF